MIKYLLILSVFLASCSALDSVEPTERTTFMKFFSGMGDYVGKTALPSADGGFLCVGNSLIEDSITTLFIKTDGLGNTEWTQQYDSVECQSLIATDNGYIIIGDRIKSIDDAETITLMHLIKTDFEGNLLNSYTFGDEDNELDYHSSSAFIRSNGDLILLGTAENEDDSESAILLSLNADDFSFNWSQKYSLINRNYENGKSMYETSNTDIIWSGSAIIPEEDEFNSYITLPVIETESQFVNNNLYGEILPENYRGEDLVKSNTGFGIVGTRTNTEDAGGDVIFLRANGSGDIMGGSEVIYDISANDKALAIETTHDGGYIILSRITTNTTLGNGGTDFFLTKVDFQGNELWGHYYGGSSNEVDGDVFQTDDGRIIIFGTTELQGVSSMVLIKTNNEGLLEN